jgi:hypothetical protein
MSIPKEKWEWFGTAGHLCVSNWCRFHMTTKVGKYLVSTVGEYYPLHASERDCPHKPTTIGLDRLYETMVFKAGKRCECGCGLPEIDGSDIDFEGYNDVKSANEGHAKMCLKWGKK